MTDALKGCRILVVEDEFYLAKDIGRTLKAEGAVVIGPYPGDRELDAALEDAPPHVAILDVNLGKGPDFGLADRMRARGVPVIFFTGYDREVIPARFADAPRLEKPLDPAHLVRAARTACISTIANMG